MSSCRVAYLSQVWTRANAAPPIMNVFAVQGPALLSSLLEHRQQHRQKGHWHSQSAGAHHGEHILDLPGFSSARLNRTQKEDGNTSREHFLCRARLEHFMLGSTQCTVLLLMNRRQGSPHCVVTDAQF